MTTSWELRYSSCEMYYLEVTPTGVHAWLDHSPAGDWYTFDQIDAGAMNGELGMFSAAERAEIDAAIRHMRGLPAEPVSTPQKTADDTQRRTNHAKRTQAKRGRTGTR